MADYKINIANFALGREGHVPQGTALAVVQVDGDVTEDVLKTLRAVDAIHEVHVAKLGPKPQPIE